MQDPQSAASLIELARQSQGRDWPRAAAVAAELRDRFPGRAAGYQIGSAAARETRRFDEAAMILAEAIARFPGEAWPVAAAGWTARARGDAEESIRLATELRRRFPENASGYQIGLAAARESRQFEEAATILADAIARFPGEAWPVVGALWTARARGEKDEPIRLAAELRRRFPENAVGYQMGASFLRDFGRLEEAEEILAQAETRFPEEAWAAKARARMARLRAARAAAAKLVEALERGRDGRIPLAFPLEDAKTDGVLHAAPEPREPGMKRRVVVVLGMHRAGTSLCARMVQELGVSLGGPLMAANFDNPEGFHEHREIVECHELLLEAMQTDWDASWLVAPPPRDFWRGEPARGAVDRLKRIVAEQLELAGGAWAFKDPRAVRFLAMWKDILGELGVRPSWILAVRDPAAVSASLGARNAIPEGLGELLWVEHYLEALRLLGPDIAAIVHYDRWFSDAPGQVRELASAIGGASDEAIDAAVRSIRTDLRHHALGANGYSLDIARQWHDRMRAEAPDLAGLQRQAEADARELEALAREVGGERRD